MTRIRRGMRTRRFKIPIASLAVCLWCGDLALTGLSSAADQNTIPPPVRQHAEQSFQHLQQHERQGAAPTAQAERSEASRAPSALNQHDSSSRYSSDQYVIGKGQGDLSKGKIVCQRVSELSARTDIAKQIRVLVKEHAIDRVRERSGREAEQDIEVTREEIVQEYLQGVKIVDRQVDEAGGTCSSTAVMPKTQLAPKPAPDVPEPTPTVIR